MPRLLLILALADVAIGPSLLGTFHFDDYYMLNDPIVQAPSGWWEVFRLERTRPLTYLTFWLNYQLGGENPVGYLAVNLLLHLGVVLAAWRVFPRVVTAPAALFAVGVLAVHPVQAEAINYIFARATILTTLFCLLTWRSWIDRRFDRAVLYFAFALLAKEEAAAFPLFLVGYEWLYRGADASPVRKWIRPWLAMIGLCGLAAARLIYAAAVTKGAGVIYDLGDITPLNYLLTQGRAFWLYVRLVLLPVGLNFDRDFGLSRGLDLPTLAAWAAVFALLAIAAVRVRKEPAWFWVLGAFVLLLPTSSFIPLGDLVAERRVYLPLVSVALAIGVVLAKAPRPVGIVILLVGAGLSVQRSLVFGTEESLWRDTVEKSPDKVRPKLQLARALGTAEPPGREEGREERSRLLREAKQLAPSDAEVATELGVFHLQAGQPREALEQFNIAVRETNPAPSALTNWGTAQLMLGARDEAIEAFDEALSKDACQYDARNNLSYVHREGGELTKALAAATLPADCRLPIRQQQALDAARRDIAAAARIEQ
jgi:tetratricopeptide (TPR) repeat protein